MTGAELLETYPKAAIAIKEFYNKKLIDSMSNTSENVSEEFKEMLKQQSFDNEYVASFIDNNPRFLFDVFDANEVYIEITVLIEENPRFMYYVNSDVNTDPFYTNRIDAEKVAIEKAFEILNEKL